MVSIVAKETFSKNVSSYESVLALYKKDKESLMLIGDMEYAGYDPECLRVEVMTFDIPESPSFFGNKNMEETPALKAAINIRGYYVGGIAIEEQIEGESSMTDEEFFAYFLNRFDGWGWGPVKYFTAPKTTTIKQLRNNLPLKTVCFVSFEGKE